MMPVLWHGLHHRAPAWSSVWRFAAALNDMQHITLMGHAEVSGRFGADKNENMT